MASYRGGLLLVVSVIFVASILLVSADAAIKLSFQSSSIQISVPCDRQFKDNVNTMILEDDFSPSGGLALQDYITKLAADIKFNKAHRTASSLLPQRPKCNDLLVILNKDLDVVSSKPSQTDPCIAQMCGQEVEVACDGEYKCSVGLTEFKAKCDDTGGVSNSDLSSALKLPPDEPITQSSLDSIKPFGGVSTIEPTTVTTKVSGLSAIIAKNPNLNLVVSSNWLTKKTGKSLQFQGGRTSGVIPYSPQTLVSGALNFLGSNFAGPLLIVVNDGSSPKWEDCSKCAPKTTCGNYGACKTESDGKSRQYKTCNDGCGRFWEETQACIIEKCVPKSKDKWKCHNNKPCDPGVLEITQICDDGCDGVETVIPCPTQNITEKCKPTTASCGQYGPCKDGKKTRSCTDGCTRWDDEADCIKENVSCVPEPDPKKWKCHVTPCAPGVKEFTETCDDGCKGWTIKKPCPTPPPCDPKKPRIVQTIPCDAPVIDAKTLPFGVVQKVEGVIITKWTDDCVSWEDKEKCEGCVANCPNCVPVHPRNGPLGTKCGGDPESPTDMEGTIDDKKELPPGQPPIGGGDGQGEPPGYTPSPTLPSKLPSGSIIDGECEDLVTSLGQEAVQFLIGEIQKSDARFLIDDLKIDSKTNPIGACVYLLTLNPNLRFTDPFLLTGPQISGGGDSCEIAETPKILDRSLLSSKLVNDLGIQIPQLEGPEDAKKRGVDLLFGQFLQQTDPEAAQQTVTEILDNLHNRTDIDEPVRQKTIQLLDKAVQDKTKAKSFSDSLDNALNLFRNNSEADAVKTVEDAVKNRFDLSLESDTKAAVDSFISTLKDKSFLLNTATDIYQKNKDAANPAAVQGIETDISSKIQAAGVSDKVKDDLKLVLTNVTNNKKKSLEILTLSQQLDALLKNFAQKNVLTNADKQQAKDLISKINSLTRQVIGDLIDKTKADAKKKQDEKTIPIVEQKTKPKPPTTIVPLTNTSSNTSSQSDQKATSLVPSIITGKVIGGSGLSITGLASGSTVVNPDHPGAPTISDYMKNINDNIKRAKNNLNLITGGACQGNINALVDAARNQLAWCPVQDLIDELAKLMDALNTAYN
ncbi:MAG: hypothetical protein HY512_00315, partial [Candidatus Aenigmarchaeota archaeon]|nr:hypothetical protein [Candidatus Aenigmarchaeota archaeon]